MAWSRPSISIIYQRIKADMESLVTSNVQIPRMSLLGILNQIFTGGIHLTYGFIEWISKQIFVDTASQIGLTRWGNILGLPQKAAQFTTGQVAFTGTPATNVPSGTVLVNSEGFEYSTEADFLIGTDTSVDVLAAEAGEAYNTADTVLTLSSPIVDVDNVATVLGGLDDGTDLEEIEDWVVRLLQRFQNPPSSGNVGDYERWALEVDGVGKSWCFPAEEWVGAGTVGVGVGTEDLDGVSAGILTDVQTYIDALKPIPAQTTYFSIVPAEIVFDIQITPNTPEIRSAIDTNLTNLFILESSPGGTTLLSHIRSAVSNSGVTDYEITQIYVNGSPQAVGNIFTSVPDTARYQSSNYSDLV